MRNSLWRYFSVFICLSIKQVVSIEFEDIYGSVTFKAGEKYTLRCSESDTETPGDYYWKIGDRNYTGRLEPSEDSILMVFEFMPTLQDNEKELGCYKNGNFDSINLLIVKQELISKSTYSLELPTVLDAVFSMSPQPKEENIFWEINSVDGSRQTFHPTEDINADIVATVDSQNAAYDEYKMKLEIRKIDDLSSKNISLTVETPTHKETIYFQPKPEIKTTELGFPSWMWILIILLCAVFIFIIGLIAYLICRKKKESKTNNGKEYIKAPIQDQQAQV